MLPPRIKIHISDPQAGFADGTYYDGNGTTAISLTPDQAAAVAQFLNEVRYADIYRHVPSHGDGNKARSPSDLETRTTMVALDLIRSAFATAIKNSPK